MSIFLKQELGRNQLKPSQVFHDPVLFLAFGFGSGLAKKAAGTFGTVAAVPLYWLLSYAGPLVYSMVMVMAVLAGIRICGQAAQKLGEHDFGGIVWDEIAGFLITMWLVPQSWTAVIVGFALFRFFDAVKPWPINWVDRHIHGGLGIMLDDVLAGMVSAVLLFWSMPYWGA